MKLLLRLRALDLAQLLQLVIVGLQHPLLVWPTFKATKKTIQICDQLFGVAHNQNNSPNAFRHALWNILICKNCFKVIGNRKKAVTWAEKITSLHEILVPNKPLETKMDLHNNKMGRQFFSELKSASEEEIINFLKSKMEVAFKISEEAEATKYKDKLVYITAWSKTS